MNIKKESFGRLSSGGEVFAYTLRNASGMSAKILNYGGIIVELRVPDKNGAFCDVVGGFDTLEDYVGADGYLGALIGRFGNRIADGRFSLDGAEYTLAQNNGKNHLHGGKVGFDSKIWEATISDGDEPSLVLRYVSPDGEEGYPGELDVTVTYTLRVDNALSISYRAITDKRTPVNLTNHSYFNLAGFDSGDVLTHELRIDADSYLPTDEGLIPTGEIASVEGTPFDFRVAKPIGRDITAQDKDLMQASGYDHCLNFTGSARGVIEKRIELYHKESGRLMEVYTDQPCVQVYTANFLSDARYPLKSGIPQKPQSFICLETECMPDSPNRSNFTNTILSPGEVYSRTTVYKFSVK